MPDPAPVISHSAPVTEGTVFERTVIDAEPQREITARFRRSEPAREAGASSQRAEPARQASARSQLISVSQVVGDNYRHVRAHIAAKGSDLSHE